MTHPAILTPATSDAPPVLDLSKHPYAAWQGAVFKGYFSTFELAMQVARAGATSWDARVVDMRTGQVWE